MASKGRQSFSRALALTLLIPAGANANSIAVSSGDLAPDADGRYSVLGVPTIKSTGTIVYRARLVDTSEGVANDSGIFAQSAISPFLASPVTGARRQLAREGQTVHFGGGSSATLADLFLSRLVLKNSLLTAVPVTGSFSDVAIELPLVSGPTDNSAIGYWDGPSESLRMLAREDDAAPDGNGTYAQLTGFRLFGITSNNRVGFFSAFDDTEDGVADDTGLFLSQPQSGGNSVVQVIREGEPAAGAINLFSSPRLNNGGTIALIGTPFPGGVLGASTIFMLPGPGNLDSVIGEGDAAPDGNGTLQTVTELRLNNLDQIAFVARLSGTDGIDGNSTRDDSAIFVGAPGALAEIVREGDLLPDGAGRFGYFSDQFLGAGPRPAFNDRGEVAFRVSLLEVPSAENLGIFRASDDEIVEIARRGDATRDGSFVAFQDPLLNNAGLVAFHADVLVGNAEGPEGTAGEFTDALFVSDGEDLVEVVRGGDTIGDFGGGRTVRFLSLNNDPTGITNGLSDSGVLAYRAEFDDGADAIVYWFPSIGWRRGSGNWDDADNWNLGLDPNSTTDVSLGTDTSLEVDGPQADTVVNRLVIGTGSGTTTLRLGSGSLATTEGMTIEAQGILDGAGTIGGAVEVLGRVVTAGALAFADAVHNQGVIEIGAGGELILNGEYRGDGRFAGPGAVTLNGLVAPGNSPGILEAEGDLAFGPD